MHKSKYFYFLKQVCSKHNMHCLLTVTLLNSMFSHSKLFIFALYYFVAGPMHDAKLGVKISGKGKLMYSQIIYIYKFF